jgi:hypothetical protein
MKTQAAGGVFLGKKVHPLFTVLRNNKPLILALALLAAGCLLSGSASAADGITASVTFNENGRSVVGSTWTGTGITVDGLKTIVCDENGKCAEYGPEQPRISDENGRSVDVIRPENPGVVTLEDGRKVDLTKEPAVVWCGTPRVLTYSRPGSGLDGLFSALPEICGMSDGTVRWRRK